MPQKVLISSKKNMEFGTKIHFLLEMIDFMNPNYSLINDDFYSSIIEDFLTSDLLKNIHNGKIFLKFCLTFFLSVITWAKRFWY